MRRVSIFFFPEDFPGLFDWDMCWTLFEEKTV
jgi:hypothetical protein